jgi:dimethylamine monooxygenase subunit B
VSSEPFEIWLVWSDRRLAVAPGASTLSVLQEAGVPIEPGCLSGGCGSCATPYVEGDVVHKDACLSPVDREREFCPCVSRARGVLVLPF